MDGDHVGIGGCEEFFESTLPFLCNVTEFLPGWFEKLEVPADPVSLYLSDLIFVGIKDVKSAANTDPFRHEVADFLFITIEDQDFTSPKGKSSIENGGGFRLSLFRDFDTGGNDAVTQHHRQELFPPRFDLLGDGDLLSGPRIEDVVGVVDFEKADLFSDEVLSEIEHRKEVVDKGAVVKSSNPQAGFMKAS